MDSLYLYVEINFLSILLLIILMNSVGSIASRSVSERFFCHAILFNILVLVADTGTWIMDGRIFFDTIWINKFVYFGYYVFTAIFAFSWARYTVYKLKVDWEGLRGKVIVYIPVAVAVLIAIVSLFNDCLFAFDDSGKYIRGEMFLVHSAILWLYLLLPIVSVVKILLGDNKQMRRRECISIIVAVLFPIIGGAMQGAIYGLNTAWTGSCISFVLIYISVQNSNMTIDALTGVKNRGCFEMTLKETIEKDRDKTYLMMIDINKFKQINDTYGHTAGDKALIELCKCLKEISLLTKNDFVGRYGGDEFAMICLRDNDAEMEKYVEEVRKKANSVATRAKLGFDMTVSIGWAKYDKEKYDTIEKFINVADEKMYANKNGSNL